MDKAKIGLIGILGDELKVNRWETLKKIKDIGYKGIEGCNFLLEGDIDSNLENMKKTGIEPLNISISKWDLEKNINRFVEDAKRIGVSYASVYYGPTDSREQLLEDARLYNEAGQAFKEAGMKLCYHNHEHEFTTFFNGNSALDILAEYAENLYFNFDCAWMTFAGVDPVYTLKKFKGRVPVIHIKDLKGTDYNGRENVEFTAVGTGVVKTRQTVETAIKTGVDWVVVEQDRLRNLTPMETVIISYLYLKELGLAL